MKRDISEHGPGMEIAVAAEGWPTNEHLPLPVRDTLLKLGEFKIKTNLEDTEGGDKVSLGPFKFIDASNKFMHNSVYMGEWVKGMRWGKGKQIW